MPVLPRHYLPFTSSNISVLLPTEHTNSFISWSQDEETMDEINHVGKPFQASVDGFIQSQSKDRIKWSNGQRESERWWEQLAWYGCIYWWKSRDFGLVNVHSAIVSSLLLCVGPLTSWSTYQFTFMHIQSKLINLYASWSETEKTASQPGILSNMGRNKWFSGL